MKRLLRPLVHRLVNRGSRAYVVGGTVSSAILKLKEVNDHGWRGIICAWDRVGDPAETVFARYQEALNSLIAQKLDAYLSIKAPSVSFDETKVRDLLQRAAPHGIRVHFDAMGPESVDPIFTLAERLRGDFSNIGVTLASRWSRSLADCQRVIDLNVPVRLVRGQWEDPEHGDDAQIERYLQIAARLVGRLPLIEVATHNVDLVRRVFSIPQMSECAELSQLFGLPLDTVSALPDGVPVRVYVPYGEPSLPYQFAQIPRNPKLAWWFVRDVFRAPHSRSDRPSLTASPHLRS